jgi:broad specificity phosphatase PhoE
MSTYSVYKSNSDYFTYDGISHKQPVLEHFGRKVDPISLILRKGDTRWFRLWSEIDTLNHNSDGDVYKVIFLGRHALATNSDVTEWDDGKDPVWASDVPLVDSPLTQDGYLQAFNVLSKWQEENSLADGECIGIPNVSYVSPMMRALVTNSITFATQLNASGGPTIHTFVHENCREQVYHKGDQAEHRKSKRCIHEMFPKFTIEDSFADDDPLWGKKETLGDVEHRATDILDSIFDDSNDNKNFVSITGHGTINSAILDIVGLNDLRGKVHHGGVIPFICKKSKTERDRILCFAD